MAIQIASGEQLARFIRKQAMKSPSELVTWTVALISVSRGPAERERVIAGLQVGLVERNPESQTATSFSLKNANILSPGDESLDFDGEVFDAAWLSSIASKVELARDLPVSDSSEGVFRG